MMVSGESDHQLLSDFESKDAVGDSDVPDEVDGAASMLDVGLGGFYVSHRFRRILGSPLEFIEVCVVFSGGLWGENFPAGITGLQECTALCSKPCCH